MTTILQSTTPVSIPDFAPPDRRAHVTGEAINRLQAAFLNAFKKDTLEQMLSFELNTRLDIIAPSGDHSFAATVHSCVVWATQRSDIGLHGLLAAALRSSPSSPDLVALAAEWQGVVFDLPPDCPYPGLQPFAETESTTFFGRDAEIEAAVQRLRAFPLLVVIGPSGSGKSSLVFAGIVPAMRRSGWFGGPDFTLLTVRPGSTASSDLAHLLPTDVPPSPGAAPGPQHTVVVFDQFEELFTIADDAAAAALQRALLKLIRAPGVTLLVTLRADFFADLMTSPLWEVVKDRRLEIGTLTGAHLSAAVAQPAAGVGVTIDPDLVERLRSDAGSEPGALPFLQETLVLLWNHVSAARIRIEDYIAIAGGDGSGLQRAMALHADGVYGALPADRQVIAKRILLHLIQFGQGRADTRRRQTFKQFLAADDDPAVVGEVVQYLVSGRLLTGGQDTPSGEGAYDLAHEALISGWPALRAWVQELEQAEQTRRRLEAKAAEHLRLGVGSGLLDAKELDEAHRYTAADAAKVLGVSVDLKTLISDSERFLNPGWNPWGLWMLGGLVLSIGLWLGVLYLRTFMLDRTVQAATWLTTGAGLGLAGLGLWFANRKQAHWVQRLSHGLAQSWRHRVALGALLAGSIAAYIVIGVPLYQQVQYCQAQPLNFTFAGPGITNIALVNEGLDPYYASLVQDVIAGSPITRAWLVAAADAQACRPFVQHVVHLQRLVTTTNEVSYQAVIEGESDAVKPEVFGEDCAVYGMLAYQIMNHLHAADVMVLPEAPVTAMPKCDAWKLNLEGYQAIQAHDYNSAIDSLKQAVALQPEYATAYNNLGHAYASVLKWDHAIPALQRAVVLSPLFLAFQLDLANAYRDSAQPNLARSIYEAALRQSPGYMPLYDALARMLITDLDDFAAAQSVLDKAKTALDLPQNSVDPAEHAHQEAVIYRNLGILHYYAEQYDAALVDLGRAEAASDRDNQNVLQYLGLTYEDLGRTQEACQTWQRLNAFDPLYAGNYPWLADKLTACQFQ